MLSQKRRKIPIQVAMWSQEAMSTHRPMIDPGSLPKHTRFNILSSRRLHNDLINLSFERHRKIVRFDYDRKLFLKKQRQKAEKSMPGFLPYFQSFESETDDISVTSLCSSRSENLKSSSLQSFSSNSFQSEDRVILPKISNKSTEDKRFQDLIDLFSTTHKKSPTANPSVQSKPSLQKRPSIHAIDDNKLNATLFDAYV